MAAKNVTARRINWDTVVRWRDPEYKQFRPVVYFWGGTNRNDSRRGQKLDPLIPGPYRND
jgi:hypothetical protein